MVKYLVLAIFLVGLRPPAATQLLWQQLAGTTTRSELANAFLAVPGGFPHVGQGGGDGMATDYGSLPWTYLVLSAQGRLVAAKPARGYGHYPTNWACRSGNVLAGAGRLCVAFLIDDTIWSRAYTQYGHPVDVRLATETPGSQ